MIARLYDSSWGMEGAKGSAQVTDGVVDLVDFLSIVGCRSLQFPLREQ